MLSPARPLRLLVVLAWMVLLTFWSSQSDLPIDRPPISTLLLGFQHRAAHLAAFVTLALLARWAFEGWPRAGLLALLFTAAFGAADEFHQTFTPGRHVGLDDWLVDSLGGGLVVVAWPRLLHERTLARTFASVMVAGLFLAGTLVWTEPYTNVSGYTPHVRLPSPARQLARDALQVARSTRSFALHRLQSIRS